jgi:dephospho-CoA kinase
VKILGLTGSIGMGKSTTAAMFEAEGVPVYDADAEVHRLYDRGGSAVWQVGERFPGVVVDGRVDRKALSKRVIGDPEALKRLESIVHPLLAEAREKFFLRAAEARADIVVLDIPLLYETGGEAKVDKVVVVTASPEVQRQRVMARDGMSEEKFAAILARQVPDADKRARADFVIDTGQGMDEARRQVREVIAALRDGVGGQTPPTA